TFRISAHRFRTERELLQKAQRGRCHGGVPDSPLLPREAGASYVICLSRQRFRSRLRTMARGNSATRDPARMACFTAPVSSLLTLKGFALDKHSSCSLV